MIIRKKEVEEIADITCDICGVSCWTGHNFECLELKVFWGYESNHDCETWTAQICEACTVKHFSIVKFKKVDYMNGNTVIEEGGVQL